MLVVGLAPSTFGQQTLPPLIPVNVLNFTIPFEIGDSANAIRNVELFVSQDRGRRWNFVAREPVETGKFAFRADGDGEYWFAFRAATSTGIPTAMPRHPELRVLVNTKNPAAVPPLSNESSSVVPPKPERFRPENMQRSQLQPMQQTNAEEPKTGVPETKQITQLEGANAEKPQFLAPRFPGVDLPESKKDQEGDLLDDLLSGMGSFLDVQPVATRNTPNHQVATHTNAVLGTPTTPQTQTFTGAPAGSITGIVLNNADTKPQIVVRWHTGDAQWDKAQIDVLRINTEGQWIPIAINLENKGEYWWYLSPEDMKPFYVAVRIRSLHGGSSVDVTQTKIEIDPRLAVFLSQRP